MSLIAVTESLFISFSWSNRVIGIVSPLVFMVQPTEKLSVN